MAETNIWLRDILPRHPHFQSSRIMAYGYNSTLRDCKNMDSRLSDFSDILLQSLGGLRVTPEERSRPMLFICHFMGGLLARLAMTRHNKYPKKFPGVSLGPCGFLFLSTPNAGSMAAEWSNMVIALTGTLAGVRANLVSELQVLNPKHVDSIDDWNEIRIPPLVRCFCESSNTGSRRVRHPKTTTPPINEINRLSLWLLLAFATKQPQYFQKPIIIQFASLKAIRVRAFAL